MKKLSSGLADFTSKLTNRSFLMIWLVFHVGIILFFGISTLTSKSDVFVDADLMNLLPSKIEDKGLRIAHQKTTEFVSSSIYILVANDDFTLAKSDAEKLFESIKDSDNFISVMLNLEMPEVDDSLTDMLYDFRWNLLSPETSRKIIDGGAAEFAENALSKVYGGFTLSSLDNLDTDPFLIEDTLLNQYLKLIQDTGTSMWYKDGVIAGQYENQWYVCMRAELSPKGKKLADSTNAVSEIQNAIDSISVDSTSRFIRSGVAQQSQDASVTATNEISVISAITFAVVILVLLLVFRSATPLVFSLLSIFVSLITAIVGTLAVFHKIHILTLVFGTSLIGACIDYSLHFFVNWKANPTISTGAQVREHLFKGLSLSLASTILCYAVMMLIPYNLIRQMGLFSIIGLISSFLTTVSIYPFIAVPQNNRTISLVSIMNKPKWWNKKTIGRWSVTILFIVPIILIAFFFKNATIYNQLDKLYTIRPETLAEETEYQKVMRFSVFGDFIIRGDTPEEVLIRDEMLRQQIAEYKTPDGEPLGYFSTSAIIPSIQAQNQSREACRILLENAEEQMEYLGFDAEDAAYVRELFEQSEGSFITLDLLSRYIDVDGLFSALWLGNLDGKYYSVLLPIFENDVPAFRNMADIDDDIFYLNDIVDVGENLDYLTLLILCILIVAFILLYVLLRFFYKRKQAAKIISIPFLILLMVCAAFSVTKTHLEFFSIIGIVLVLGLGLDYIIYMIENENKSKAMDETQVLEPFGILFSFFTTAISFGALSLSSFAPVHYICTSIFIGLLTAYIASFFYDRS